MDPKQRAANRINKELMKFQTDGDPELKLDVCIPGEVWDVSFDGPPDSIYAGEKFTLRIRFTDDYPMDSPEVTFLTTHCPVHEHVYSNGHICLNILGDDWSPAQTVMSVCKSIRSMLGSATEKKRPPDNARYTKGKPSNPKQTNFVYHDDKV